MLNGSLLLVVQKTHASYIVLIIIWLDTLKFRFSDTLIGHECSIRAESQFLNLCNGSSNAVRPALICVCVQVCVRVCVMVKKKKKSTNSENAKLCVFKRMLPLNFCLLCLVSCCYQWNQTLSAQNCKYLKAKSHNTPVRVSATGKR